MSEQIIQISAKTFTVGDPSLEKVMRITDYISEVLEELPEIFQDVETFQSEYKISHREIMTREEFENPEYSAVVEALGFTAEDFEDSTKVVTDEVSGDTGLPFYKSPDDFQTIAHVFPKVWKVARENLVDLCALITITDGELEEHDRRGAVNGLIKERAHFIKYNAQLDELLSILSIGLVIVKDQIESASKSLGKVSEDLTAIIAPEQVAPTEEPSETPVEQNDAPQ
jgi:hypothetical protein